MKIKYTLCLLIALTYQTSLFAADQSFLSEHAKTAGVAAATVLAGIAIGFSSSANNDNSNVTTSSLENTNYLYSPTGTYGVGYEDLHWINQRVCPDGFFSGKNQYDFSVDNRTQFCREIMVRVYYPAAINTQSSSPYYQSLIEQWQLDLSGISIPSITPQQIASLSSLTTDTKESAPLALHQSFPVIIFNPGIDSNAQEYMNVISDIVSHGYIVVAVNNTFISKVIAFPDQHIVLGITPGIPDSGLPKILDMTMSDIIYTYEKIKTSHHLDPIFAAMDLQHIGLLGHSLGGVVAVKSAHVYPTSFQAAAALDAPYNPEFYDPLSGFEIPFLHIHAAHWSTTYPTAEAFDLKNYAYLVLLTPDRRDINYSRHNNFSDRGTLQYQPVIKAFNNYISWGLDVGTINGYEGTKTINQYLIAFFDQFFKNKSNMIFKTCTPLPRTLLTCGPSTGKG